MSPREFLKLTIWKIILAAVFLFVGFSLLSYSAFRIGPSVNYPLFYVSLIFMWSLYLISSLNTPLVTQNSTHTLGLIIQWIAVILTLFYNYFLACLVIYIFKRKRK